MILEKLISLMCEELGYCEGEIDEKSLLADFVSDDLETEELVLALESEFEIEIDEELSGDITVSELADMIENILSEDS